MKTHLSLLVLSLTSALAACVTDYTKSEAPNNLRVDGAQRSAELSFIPGSARLAHADAIAQLVAAGQIRPSDRVTIAAGGPPRLAAQRTAVISSELLRYRIVADASPLDNIPADLVSGRAVGPAPATPNVTAVTRYFEDRVKQPPTPTASPFSAPTGGGGGDGGGGAPGGGAPAGGAAP